MGTGQLLVGPFPDSANESWLVPVTVVGPFPEETGLGVSSGNEHSVSDSQPSASSYSFSPLLADKFISNIGTWSFTAPSLICKIILLAREIGEEGKATGQNVLLLVLCLPPPCTSSGFHKIDFRSTQQKVPMFCVWLVSLQWNQSNTDHGNFFPFIAAPHQLPFLIQILLGHSCRKNCWIAFGAAIPLSEIIPSSYSFLPSHLFTAIGVLTYLGLSILHAVNHSFLLPFLQPTFSPPPFLSFPILMQYCCLWTTN